MAPAAAPQVIPWRHVAAMCATSTAIAIPAYVIGGPGVAMGAIAGMSAGAFAALGSGVPRAASIAALATAVLALTIWIGTVWIVLLLCAVFVGLVMAEARWQGTRSLVMALFAYLMSIVGIGFGGDWMIVPFFALGAAAGIVMCQLLKLAGIMPKMPVPASGAVGLGLFLGLGLAIALLLVLLLDEPRGYWIALFFVGRAIIPYEGQRQSALRFGQGSMAGVLVALCFQMLGPPAAVQWIIALAASIAAVRFLPHRLPISSACFSMIILLTSATTFGDAIFRAEAIAIVVALIFFLTFGIDRLWAWLNARFPAEAAS